jgi:hypothetical protein
MILPGGYKFGEPFSDRTNCDNVGHPIDRDTARMSDGAHPK